MRKTLIAFAATTGLVGLGVVGAAAAPGAPVHLPGQAANIQHADFYCGPRCEYWRHRNWEAHEWREHHPYYGYNRGYYGYNGYYYR